MPRCWQRTRPSLTSGAFIPPQALAVFESAILFSSLLTPSTLSLPSFFFAASPETNSVQRESKRLLRRWQRKRPSQPSSGFIPPRAVAVFGSAILFSSLLGVRRALFNYYKDAYTFHPFPFFLLFAASPETNSVQRKAKLLPRRWQRTRPSQTSSVSHPSASSYRSLKVQFSSLRGDARWTMFNITRTLTPSTLSLSSSFCSLMSNELGPEGGKAVAAALAKNTTITTIEWVHPSASTCHLWKPQFSSLRWDAKRTLFNITRTLTLPPFPFLPSFCRLYENNLGPEGGKAVAAALAKNTTITSMQCVHPPASPCRL